MKRLETDSLYNADIPVHHYSSERKKNEFVETFRKIFKEFPAAHSLGFTFAKRNIQARYRQSIFGIFWAFISPIATAIIWVILKDNNVVSIGNVGTNYPLFVITGTMLWSVFSSSLLMPMQTMQANKSILVKINFPREALLVNAFYEILFNTLVVFVIIIIELILFKVPITLHSLLFIPSIFILIILGMSFGLLLFPFSFLYKDFQFALPPLLQFAMYLTPVVYSKPLYNGFIKVLALNPVTPVLTNARAWLLDLDTVVPVWQIGAVFSFAILLFIIGIFLQRATIEILIERMGS